MKIALIGYGKMGKEIERVARQKGIEIAAIIDPNGGPGVSREINATTLKNADVAIDFTTPDSALENIKKVSAAKKNIVMATTGWYSKMDEAKKIVDKAGIGMITSTNFSIGVNLYFKMVEEAAKLVNKVDSYDIFAYEMHHNQKVDAPSGTAKTIGEILVKNIDRKSRPVHGSVDRKINPDELNIASIRAGNIPGTHVVGFDSEADTIELKHVARSRAGFATGSLMAAQWIIGKKGTFTMDNFMDDYFKTKNVSISTAKGNSAAKKMPKGGRR